MTIIIIIECKNGYNMSDNTSVQLIGISYLNYNFKSDFSATLT